MKKTLYGGTENRFQVPEMGQPCVKSTQHSGGKADEKQKTKKIYFRENYQLPNYHATGNHEKCSKSEKR